MIPLIPRNGRRAGLAGDSRGMVLAMVLVFMGIMLMLALFLLRIIQSDARLVRQTQLRIQAENVAQAGLDVAFADIMANGYGNRSDFTGSVGYETYTVTYRTADDPRNLDWDVVTSQATVGNVTAIISAEIEGHEGRSALEFLTSASNYLEIFAQNNSELLDLTGEIHCNRRMYLFAQNRTEILVTGQLSTGDEMELRAGGQGGEINITGDVVHPVNKPPTFSGNQANITVGGQIREEDLPDVRFPLLDWTEYRQAAINNGWHFNGSQTIGSAVWGTSGGGSVVYVDGDLTLRPQSTLTLHGSLIVTGNITMRAQTTFEQRWSGNPDDVDVVIAQGVFNSTQGNLTVERGIVYGITSFRIHERAGAVLDVTGALMSQGELVIHGSQAGLRYVHELLIPDHIVSGGVGADFRVRSYNPSHQIN